MTINMRIAMSQPRRNRDEDSLNVDNQSGSRRIAALAVAQLTLLSILSILVATGCGPTFDPPSLIESTRVVGARVEVSGAADRATPAPGERATVTWLMTAPGAMPALGWAFALCAPGTPGELACERAPFALYRGTETPPRVALSIPAVGALGATRSLILFGRICVGSVPTFDATTGVAACDDGGQGTSASVVIGLQTDGAGADANHNPVADRGLTFDGQQWAAPGADADPCAAGPRVSAGSDDHVIGVSTVGGDREAFTALYGDPPVPTAFREGLQISHFATAGKLKNPYDFIEGDLADADPVASVKWNAPKVADVTGPMAVSFRFVVRDSRGGTDWTARALCVTP
jgi:hypothetical protein